MINREFEKKLDIITFSGDARSCDSNFHIRVFDENCSVFGGKLLPGIIVLKSLDVLIGSITINLGKTSISSSKYNLKGLIFMSFLIVLGQRELLSLLTLLV